MQLLTLPKRYILLICFLIPGMPLARWYAGPNPNVSRRMNALILCGIYSFFFWLISLIMLGVTLFR